jgi:hypothetical protein
MQQVAAIRALLKDGGDKMIGKESPAEINWVMLP